MSAPIQSGDSSRKPQPETNHREITIIRGKHDRDNPYFVASRNSAQDDNLSYEARGLLFYLLSKPDDWVIRIDDLRRAGCGRDKIYRIIDELVSAGYMTARTKHQDGKGRWVWTPHKLYERPYPENPYTDEPYTENTEIKALSTESLSTENRKESSDASNTTLEGRNVTRAIEEKISDGKSTVATRSGEHTEVTAAASETDHTPSREAVEKQAETAPPESSAKAPPAEPSPACTPTREQRDAMFEAVCGHIFGVVGKDNIREMARSEHSRVGKIVSWLLKQSDGFAPNGSKKAARVVVGWISVPAQPEHVEKFAAQYKQKHRDASLPLDIVKFTDAWRAWGSELARESRRKAARAQQAEARQAERPQVTPEERAAMKAQLQAARNSLKAERTDA